MPSDRGECGEWGDIGVSGNCRKKNKIEIINIETIIMNLQDKKTKTAYDLWKVNFPESLDQRDLERFDSLSLILLENDDEISESEIISTMGDNYEEEKADYLFDRFHVFADFFRLITQQGYSK